MLVRKGKSKLRQSRRDELKDQYKKQIGPLRVYLLLECAPLVVDPIEIADEAFECVFETPGRYVTYGEVRKIAEGIVDERRRAGRAQKVAEYSLEKIFDPYLMPNDAPVREVLRALDALSLAERGAIEAALLHLLTMEGLAETVGGSASTRRVQKKKALEKLAEAKVDLEPLELFFASMRGNCGGN
ncbi:hypothetical protein [Streptomyces sp. V4I2]|uniref:hypothetical protein n=1 Tax=Streptomyces sp. V4I2 TaxID=3042280 RepID=UPI00277FFD25|nr:hypothetical protein [Streptomyces sp. V4I2]MDQ1041817.1 DNA-directed RNA polymerase specialized sigma24 family protein [Streptomyces sp. V4I2]